MCKKESESIARNVRKLEQDLKKLNQDYWKVYYSPLYPLRKLVPVKAKDLGLEDNDE